MRAGVAVAAVLALAGLGACGKPHDGKRPSGPPLTKAEYIAKIKDIGRDVRGGVKVPRRTPPLVRAAANADKAGSALREMSHRLGELNPPPEVRRAHRLFALGVGGLGARLPAVARALRAGNVKRVRTLLISLRGSPAAREVATARRLFARRGYHFIGVPQPDGG